MLAALAADITHMLAVAAHGFTALTADLRHMLAVLAHGLATLAADVRSRGGATGSESAGAQAAQAVPKTE